MKLILASSITLVVSAFLAACSGAPNDPVGTEGAELSTAAATTAAAGPTAASTVVRDPICPNDEKLCRLEKADGKCADVCVKDYVLCATPVKCEPSSTAAGGAPDPDGGPATSSGGGDPASSSAGGGPATGGSGSGSSAPSPSSAGGGPATGGSGSGSSAPSPSSGGGPASDGGSGDPGPSTGTGHPICDPDGKQPEPGCKWDTVYCVWICA
jgi:hypothetical protein